MSTSFCNVTVTPDLKKVVIYDRKSGVTHFHTLDQALTLEFTYNPLITPASTYIIFEYVSFSADNQLAILEFNDLHPTIVLNLTDYSTVYSISVGDWIDTTAFAENSSRFIFMQCFQTELIIDLGVTPPLMIPLTGRLFSYSGGNKIDKLNSVLYSISY